MSILVLPVHSNGSSPLRSGEKLQLSLRSSEIDGETKLLHLFYGVCFDWSWHGFPLQTAAALLLPTTRDMRSLTTFIGRRYHRLRRRRKVGRAYDMALEIAQALPRRLDLLDVGCGNGFIAHHLSSLLDANVTGIDVGPGTAAGIRYQKFDGSAFPFPANSFDAVLLCYVLHHAANRQKLLGEVRRVLREGGVAIIYEDMPLSWWDRLVCGLHDFQWRGRTGPCRFHCNNEWLEVFKDAGFLVVKERSLSRWRNLAHPVARHFYVLTVGHSVAKQLAA